MIAAFPITRRGLSPDLSTRMHFRVEIPVRPQSDFYKGCLRRVLSVNWGPVRSRVSVKGFVLSSVVAKIERPRSRPVNNST